MHFCYSLGALINFYSHTLSATTSGLGPGAAGTLVPDYILYGLNDKIHPRLWSANARDIWQWWLKRSPAPDLPGPLIQTIYSPPTAGYNPGLATVYVSGARDDRTAIEILVPGNGSCPLNGPYLKVFRDGVRTLTDFRTDGRTIKVKVGTSTHMVLAEYKLLPRARDDTYIVSPGATIAAASGVLTNDSSPNGATLTAHNCSDTTHFTLNSNGSVVCPSTLGQYTFTYQATDGTNDSLPATVNVNVRPSTTYLVDDFARNATDENTLGSWVIPPPSVAAGADHPLDGDWKVSGGIMQGAAPWDASSGAGHYGIVHYDNNWSSQNYSVEARIRFTPGAYGGGVGGRYNSDTMSAAGGSHYAAWIFPEDSPYVAGRKKLQLVKFDKWTHFTPIGDPVDLPSVSTNWHTVKLDMQSNQIQVYFDGVAQFSSPLTDASYTTGGVSLDLWAEPETPANMSIDHVVVAP